jgi:hypothetical protein
MRPASSTRTQSKTLTTTDCPSTTQRQLFRFSTRNSTSYQSKPELTSYFTYARQDSIKRALIIFKKSRISKMKGKRRKTKRQQRQQKVKNSRKLMVILSHQMYLKIDKLNTTLRKLFRILLKCSISNRLGKFLNRWHVRTLQITSLPSRKEIIISFCRIKILAFTGISLMRVASSILVTRRDSAIFSFYAKTLKMYLYSWPSSSVLSITKRVKICAKIHQWQQIR